MTQAFALGRSLLCFGEGDEAAAIVGDLSAATFGPDGALWVASDELSGERIQFSRLEPTGPGLFARHQQYAVGKYVDLFDEEQQSEADIEGLDYAGGCLWFTGSHSGKRSKPKGKNAKKDLQRLAEVEVEANRFLLGRIPLVDGLPEKSAPDPLHPDVKLRAARLEGGDGGNALIAALRGDRHIGPFLRTIHGDDGSAGGLLVPLASKENGFDIEGLAVCGDRVFLGLRGPVLRGWATLLEIEPRDSGKGMLTLAPMPPEGRLYRKHFLDLGGFGIRELGRDGDDLLILAGPTMAHDGLLRFFRLRDAAALDDDSITGRADGRLVPLFDLPVVPGFDYAEGFASTAWHGQRGLLVVYDGPSEARRPAAGSVFADVFWLHG